ncbi:feline leukemia virus subgroup C receptor-related protein 2-like protein [Dinothrombium tinctorium]|uniref:Feline leukemia virus subgroup C receptor-related protein 2-like protein n=1 Tax=Dinothrombium tinctorium TaxID=1965070 RepID=A0A3S3NST4_9ACAR|nr:feline leukemia virus subgroup C receptor-related protein 2-like protein [Dinothrombium tinctorium]RWS05363.1 feline leukemia virus subgroup C receptor-related protein 2-like protein [Dinothrombium tinctorium]RWS06860.1 feline leukemia virus subgroup C receptor-related protein 2-like protein [Dinothrombium tinctorium]
MYEKINLILLLLNQVLEKMETVEEIPSNNNKINVYKKRFYASIASALVHFYDVTFYEINLLTIIYSLLYVFGLLPINLIVDKYGIRAGIVLSSSFLSVGLILKYLACSPHLYFVALIGQAMVALSTSYTYSCPMHIVPTWFPMNEINRAVSFLMVNIFIGLGIGFIPLPMIIANVKDKTVMAEKMRIFMLTQAGISILLLILIVIFFDDKPKLPPSASQHKANEYRESTSVFSSLKSLFKNRNYLVLMTSAGLINGVYSTLLAILNQMLLSKFPQSQKEVGFIGMLLLISGCFSSPFLGLISKRFALKTLYKLNAIMLLCPLIFFSLLFKWHYVWLFFIATPVLGFFFTCNTTLAMMFASDLTYPYSESISSSVLSAVNQLFGIILTFLGSKFIIEFDAFVCNLAFLFLLMISVLLNCFIGDYKGREANERILSDE